MNPSRVIRSRVKRGQPLRAAVDAEHLPVRRGHDPVEGVGARRRRLEIQRREALAVMGGRAWRAREHDERGQERDARLTVQRIRAPSFMWCARPSFSLVKSTSNAGVSSLPFQLKPRRNCSLSSPPLSQFASSDDVMYRRLPSQLCEIMLTCLPVTFS